MRLANFKTRCLQLEPQIIQSLGEGSQFFLRQVTEIRRCRQDLHANFPLDDRQIHLDGRIFIQVHADQEAGEIGLDPASIAVALAGDANAGIMIVGVRGGWWDPAAAGAGAAVD